jgi:beta-galactosidase
MRARLYLLVFFCFVQISLSFTQELNLKSDWHFKTDPNQLGEQQKWFSKVFDDSSWELVQVPHLWDLENEYANYKGKAWYRKDFTLNLDKNKRVFVALGEIGMSYTLYIDGKKVGYVLAGNYLEDFDVTDLLSNEEKHQITLEIDNTLGWGAYWSWGGIRRFVKVSQRNLVFIERQEIIAQPDLDKQNATVQTAVIIKNNSSKNELVNLNQLITSGGKNISLSNKKGISVPAQSEIKVLLKHNIGAKSLKLWHFDHPHLYESKLELFNAKNELGSLKDRFGIRKIEIKAQQLYLNGEKIRLAGYNWVADDRATGSVLPEYRYKEDIDLMKAAGANLARLSHRPLPKDVLDYLDEVGMLIISEFNNWPQFMNGVSEEPKIFAQKLIQQSFNHPSIIGWSVGNENGNLKEFPGVNDYTKNIISYIKKELDSTRLVAYVSHTADFQDNDAAQFGDIVHINKYGNYEKAVDELTRRYPDKAIFMSEYGGHADNLIYDTPNNTLFKSLMVDKLGAKSNLIGYSIWTFNDYRSTYQSPNLATSTPVHQNRQWGIVDVYRNKKRAFRQMQNFYAPVRAITINNKQNNSEAEIVLEPRNHQDIPAFTLKGYQLVWELRDVNHQNLKTGFIALSDVRPGDAPIKSLIKWSVKNVVCLKVSLLSSTGYSVKDTTVFFREPLTPKIKHFITGSSVARIVFDKDEFATSYKAYYETDGVVKATEPTIEHYVDVNQLTIGKTYKIWLVGINSFGESKASEIKIFKPEAGFTSLPPVIWQSQAGSSSFAVGYSHYYSDALYKIRYGTSVHDVENWKTISTNNFSMIRVPNLQNGQTYYYQISRSPVFYPTANQWSEVMSVTPQANQFKQDVFIHGYTLQDDKLLVSFEPIKNAISYEVVCETDKGIINYTINKSAVSFAVVNLNNQLKIKSLNVKSILNYN